MITIPNELADYVDQLINLIDGSCEVWWFGSGAAGKQTPKDFDLLVKGCPPGTYDKLAGQRALVEGSRFDVFVETPAGEYRPPWPTDSGAQKQMGVDEWGWTLISETVAEYTGEGGKRCRAIRLHPQA